ncbi:hypothetical protein [Cupriavidus taiwanensis]|uniref:Rap1a immunity protein domain-containing protein n=1 Tax=Cupriavidus taiwanensis (strain DSM 17343 / BCRC 17206 / CCUG 44338 / CIP 107171 / LMG 19424 / R1) TaxID=977880 RepID=B3R9J2_CUPTR|nr:hypothetical protein [Cupriavidus taiwanensis]CAQ71567.1 hypothetical protein; putative exported protein [Cupriavidus taiwanensis LMG 19424]
MKKLIITALGGALLSGNAMADIMWKDYRIAAATQKNEKEVDGLLDVYIAGATSSLGVANAQLQFDNKTLLYCQPGKLSLNPSNVRAMLDDRNSPVVAKFKDNMPLGMAIYYVLREAFPCK